MVFGVSGTPPLATVSSQDESITAKSQKIEARQALYTRLLNLEGLVNVVPKLSITLIPGRTPTKDKKSIPLSDLPTFTKR